MRIRRLPEHLQTRANNELNEIPSRTSEDIRYIQEWIQKQRHLIARTDDQFILTFLRGSKFSLQRTKEKLEFYYGVRKIVPEFFADRDPLSEEIQVILKAGVFVILPQDDLCIQPVTLWWCGGKTNPKTMTLVNILKVLLMLVEIVLLENDSCTISGVRVVLDYMDLSLNCAAQVNPAILRKFLLTLLNGYPLRVENSYQLNVIPLFETFYAMCKPFLSHKLRSKMHIYQKDKLEDFCKSVSRAYLPRDFGGDLPSLAELGDECKKKVESYRNWFLNDSKYGSNEDFRPANSKTFVSDALGIEGSFRCLTVD